MVSTLDRCIGLESSRVIDPLLPVGYRLGRFGVVNFDEKRNGIKIFLVDFVKMLLMQLTNWIIQQRYANTPQMCLHPWGGGGGGCMIWQKHLWLTAPKIFLQKIHGLFHIHSTFDMTLKKPTKVSLFQCIFLWKYLPTHLSEDFFLDFAFQTNLNDKRTSGSVCISGWVGPKRQKIWWAGASLKNWVWRQKCCWQNLYFMLSNKYR